MELIQNHFGNPEGEPSSQVQILSQLSQNMQLLLQEMVKNLSFVPQKM